MKLIIDIPEEEYKCVQITGCIGNNTCVSNAIYKGTPLDKIRAELHATAEMHEDGDYYLREEWIDEIIDKYKAESEQQESEDI